MQVKHPRSLKSPDLVKRVRAFLADSTNDYIAARVLFLSELPQQAAILSSTAIEKAFKAILAFHGNESHGHLKKAHWNAVRNFDSELFSRLDQEFLTLNQKAYLLRYTDSLPSGFNLVIATREFLAELDHTLMTIHSGFNLVEAGTTQQTAFRTLLTTKDPRLTSENHVLAMQRKNDFAYSTPQFIYEVRNDPPRGVIEVTYYSNSHPKRLGFMREGFLPSDGNHMSYDLSHLPQAATEAIHSPDRTTPAC